MINQMSKSQLVELVRRVSGSAGDYARKSKQDFIEQVAALPQEKVAEAISSMGLISGSLAPVAAPTPSAAVEVPKVEVVARKSLREVFGTDTRSNCGVLATSREK